MGLIKRSEQQRCEGHGVRTSKPISAAGGRRKNSRVSVLLRWGFVHLELWNSEHRLLVVRSASLSWYRVVQRGERGERASLSSIDEYSEFPNRPDKSIAGASAII